nr:MAG TPA: hypothetical protein [Caudoviricetes sp.]
MSDEWKCAEMEYMECDGVEVQDWLDISGAEIYSAGKLVTYHVDTDTSYQEKVRKGQSCLVPTTFAPAKSGWTFCGWRTDSTASGEVLSEKVMGREPINLYAVFQQTVTLSYNGNGAGWGSTEAQYGTRYYNNGYTDNPVFVLRGSGFGRTDWSFSKWALNSSGGTQYSAGASIRLAGNATMYAVWVRPSGLSISVTSQGLAGGTSWSSGAYGSTSGGRTTSRTTNLMDLTGLNTYTATAHGDITSDDGKVDTCILEIQILNSAGTIVRTVSDTKSSVKGGWSSKRYDLSCSMNISDLNGYYYVQFSIGMTQNDGSHIIDNVYLDSATLSV